MQSLKYITYESLSEQKQRLEKMSAMTEFDIQVIWRESYEQKCDDFKDLVYNYDIPLYQKMIFRFRHAEMSPSKFIKQLDPVNQQRILSYLQIYDTQLVEFLAWLKNGIGIFDLHSMQTEVSSIDDVENTQLYKFWSKNEIVFFFAIDKILQDTLITRYNKECVDTYNEMITSFFI